MDNHHVNITPSHISCGIVELYRLESDSRKVLFALANYEYHPSRGNPHAYAIWSDVPDSNGAKLYKEIMAHLPWSKPATMGPVINPQTGNPIFTYIWAIPHEEFRKWYKEEKIKRINNQ